MSDFVSIFHNKILEKALFEEGFVTTQIFNSEELINLRELFKNNLAAYNTGLFNNIYMTTWSSDKDHKRVINTGLRSLFTKACNRIFHNYRSLNHVFIAKESNEQSEFTIHQDWSIVDENLFYSFNVWVALEDIDEKDGALWVMPKSHLINQRIRGCGVLFPNYNYLFESIKEKVKCIPLKAGEGLLFFHSTLHGSPSNVSGKKRIIAVNSIVPKQAPLRIHFQKESNTPLEIYEPSDDFVYEYENIREESILYPPKGVLIEKKSSINLNHIVL